MHICFEDWILFKITGDRPRQVPASCISWALAQISCFLRVRQWVTDCVVWRAVYSSGGGVAGGALMAPGTGSAESNHLLKEQAQRRRLQQARLPATSQAKANVDKPLFGPPIQVFLLSYLRGFKWFKRYCSSFWETRLIVTECHLPYGIIQGYLPLDTDELASPQPQPDRPVLDLSIPERWKAELTLVLVIYLDGLCVRRQSLI